MCELLAILLALASVVWLINELRPKTGTSSPRAGSSSASRVRYGSGVDWGAPARYGFEPDDDELLPNGYTVADYERYGISRDEVEFWGLDQPGAPPPDTAGWVVWDMVDGMGW